MRLATLRKQMLIAMGLPACWVTPTPTAPPADPAPAPVRVGAATCGRDTVFETMCGRSEPKCGSHGDSLTSFGQSTLHVTSSDAETSLYADFRLDPAATEEYRTSLQQRDIESYCCYSQCTPLDVGVAKPIRPRPGFRVMHRCLPAPRGGTREPARSNEKCPAGIRLDGALRPYVRGDADQCCYGVEVREPERIKHYRGRPARVDGAPSYADVGASGAWRAALAPDTALPDVLRARLAAAWLEVGRMEHASIAAFASLSLRLLALGAPPELVAAAHAAALDEIEHARIAFELASAYGGAPVAPARFPGAARMAASEDLAALALETFVDGCIGETSAALEAERAAAAAEDPVIASALARIAEDETRHAELAWAIVAWCVRQDAMLLPALGEALAGAGPAPSAAARPDLALHGVLGDEALAVVRADTLREVVAPCLAALAA